MDELFGGSDAQTRHQCRVQPQLAGKAKRKLDRAKSLHRPSLKLHRWSQDGFAGSDACRVPRHLGRSLIDTVILDNRILPPNTLSMSVPLERAEELSVERFRKDYEAKELPLVISGVPDVQSWSARQNWDISNLKKVYGDAELKCGEDDDGNTVRVKLKHFLRYMKDQIDDSPLYIFDSTFYERSLSKSMDKDYSVPKYFPEDLFSMVGEDRRPPYKWFLVGPKRSGTSVHIDPLGTSAWNTLLSGRKRWVLFPPELSKRFVKGKDFILDHEDDEPVHYFANILPRMKRAMLRDLYKSLDQETGSKEEAKFDLSSVVRPSVSSAPSREQTDSEPDSEDSRKVSKAISRKVNLNSMLWDSTAKSRWKLKKKERRKWGDVLQQRIEKQNQICIYEFIQEPGETVFIPGGWWHAVLNLEDSIAVTQNYASSVNFDRVWRKTRSGRRKMAMKWRWKLKCTRGDLYERSVALDIDDGVKNPKEIKKDMNEMERKAQSKKEKKARKRKKGEVSDHQEEMHSESMGGKRSVQSPGDVRKEHAERRSGSFDLGANVLGKKNHRAPAGDRKTEGRAQKKKRKSKKARLH